MPEKDRERAEAILADLRYRFPRPGQRRDHDSPDMSHPDQTGDDAEVERRIGRGERLHRRPR